jgi:hypothetical protein
MSAIQTTATGWIDGFASLAGGQIGQGYDSMNEAGSWGTTDSDSFTSMVSDVEEEGEVEEGHEHTDTHQSQADAVGKAIANGTDELEAPAEVVAAIAANIGLIEAAMKKHQSTGINSFTQEEDEQTEASDEELKAMLAAARARRASRMLAAIKVRTSRSYAISLLA